MGTWSHKILDDDFAGEIASTYIERLYEGADAQAATDQVIGGPKSTMAPGSLTRRRGYL